EDWSHWRFSRTWLRRCFSWRHPLHWYIGVLVAYQFIGCAPIDSLTVPTKQVQMINALTLKFWSDPSPLRVGANHIFVEVNAPTRNAMVNRDVLLTYQSAEGTTSTVRMQPVPGQLDVFTAVIELDSPGKTTFSASVQSPTKPPAVAHFQLPVTQFASTEILSTIERADD
ncbi:MAG TPA: hypothetical protein VJ805_01330, partial [Nitrospiraceae bacterium]|nr:hypothetical protein [Nitrospiraceae bacterium]